MLAEGLAQPLMCGVCVCVGGGGSSRSSRLHSEDDVAQSNEGD
jgi:hypothetical protein